MIEHMLTTSDNPFNPFTQFDEWYAYDVARGHNTLAYQARVLVSSDELSDYDQSLALEQAIDEIVAHNVNGLYMKVAQPEA